MKKIPARLAVRHLTAPALILGAVMAPLGFLLETPLTTSANALTFKSGQVLGSDGQLYDGASPEQAANIAANAGKENFFGTTKTAGVVGTSLYVVIDGKATFIPLDRLRGKSKDEVKNVVKSFVIAESLGLDLNEIDENTEGFLTAIESRIEGIDTGIADGFTLEESVAWDNALAGATDAASQEAVAAAFEAAHQAVTESYEEIEGSVWENIDGEMVCTENCGADGSGIASPGN